MPDPGPCPGIHHPIPACSTVWHSDRIGDGGGMDGNVVLGLVSAGLGIGVFVGATMALISRRIPRDPHLLIPRSWKVAGWFVWLLIFLGGRGAIEALDHAAQSNPLPIGFLPVMAVLSGLSVAGIIWVGAGLEYYGDRRALRWALVLFILDTVTAAAALPFTLGPGDDPVAGVVVLRMAFPVAGLLAALIAVRTPLRRVDPAAVEVPQPQ